MTRRFDAHQQRREVDPGDQPAVDRVKELLAAASADVPAVRKALASR